MTTKKATLIKDNLSGFNGHAALYRLSEPIGDHKWSNDAHDYDECDGTGTCSSVSLVIVSATEIPYVGGTETYIFPGIEDGTIASWGELPGSLKDTLDHAEALREAGYEIAEVA